MTDKATTAVELEYLRLYDVWKRAKAEHESLLYSKDREAVVKAREAEVKAWEALFVEFWVGFEKRVRT